MNVRPMRPDSSFLCALACVKKMQRASTDAAVRRLETLIFLMAGSSSIGFLTPWDLYSASYAVIGSGAVLRRCQVPPGGFVGGVLQLRVWKPLRRKAHRKTRRWPESVG